VNLRFVGAINKSVYQKTITDQQFTSGLLTKKFTTKEMERIRNMQKLTRAVVLKDTKTYYEQFLFYDFEIFKYFEDVFKS
jgi:hypothetical protein